MMRLQADIAEIQGLAQAQSQREQPFAGIAAQWSAANAGMPSSPLGPLAQANPLPGGLGAAAAATPAPRPAGAPQRRRNEEDEVDFETQALGTAQGALAGAAAGAPLGPWGIAAGALVGGVGGYMQSGG